jgi:tRNA nucleotidyltransferase (CCA-adding enzyme)
MYLPNILYTISKRLIEHNAKAIVVGGAVRDYHLSLPIKDYDIEVYGVDIDTLARVLSDYGSVNFVGKSFGVLKFVYMGEEYDFSMPRVERSVGDGHRDFDVSFDSNLSFEEASRRRDFTLNAMGYNIESGEYLDPFGGLEDISRATLRHIDSNTFIEDPLRVYRAVQFCGRFGYELASETIELCKMMVGSGALDSLPKERIYTEWSKLLLKSPKPSIGLELMRKLGILRYYPELRAIIGVAQSPTYHPEGDVWIHTMMSIDAMATLRSGDDRLDLRLSFATLCHDLGKATHTTIDTDGCIRSIGHEEAGVEPTTSLLYRITNEQTLISSILPLIKYHLAPSQLYRAKSSSRAIRKLSTKVNIGELIVVAKADFLGRSTEESKSGIYKAGEWLEQRAIELKVDSKPPLALILGRDLIALGLTPSPKFKEILADIYGLQIDGEVSTKEEALEVLKSLIYYQKLI